MSYKCPGCKNPLVPGDTYCEHCGIQFPQGVPLVSIGEDQPTTQNKPKLSPWPTILRVATGLIALSGMFAGAHGEVAGAVGFVVFALVLFWTFPDTEMRIKQRLSLATLGIGMALVIYSFTPAGKVADASYKHDQLEADRQTNSAPTTDTPKPPAPAIPKPDQPVEDVGTTLTNIGEEGYLSSGEPSLTMAVDEDTLNSLEDAVTAKDTVGVKQLIEAGKVYTVENRTRAKLLDLKFPGRSKVRIASGPHTNEIGWIEKDCLKQGNDTPGVATSASEDANSGTNPPFNLQPGFKTTYQVIKREDMSMANASRWTVRIALPAHLTRKEVEQNLRYAAKEQWDRNQPNALTVFAYRKGSDYEGPVTAGQCDFAPYGDWTRASEHVTIDQYKLVVQLEDEYFSPR